MPGSPGDPARATEREAECWRRFRDGEQRRPPSLALELRAVLTARFPNADEATVQAAARFIDDAVRAWVANDRALKIRKSATIFEERKRTVAGDLRHLARALKTGNAERAEKAWREMGSNTIATIHAAFPGDYEASLEACYPPGALFPEWSAVETLLPAARQIAERERLRGTAWRADGLIEIAEQLQRLTGRPMPRQQPALEGRNRRGQFVELLDALEDFYRNHYPDPVRFGVQTNGRALDAIRDAVK